MRKIVPLVVAACAPRRRSCSRGAGEVDLYLQGHDDSGRRDPEAEGPSRSQGPFHGDRDRERCHTQAEVKLTFSGLSGKVVAAHVHKGKAGVAGGVLIPLCGPCTSGQTGQLTISNDAADLLERGPTYVNAHTTKNKGGEIRGQIKLLDHVGAASSPSPVTTPTTTTPDDGGGDGGKGNY